MRLCTCVCVCTVPPHTCTWDGPGACLLCLCAHERLVPCSVRAWSLGCANKRARVCVQPPAASLLHNCLTREAGMRRPVGPEWSQALGRGRGVSNARTHDSGPTSAHCPQDQWWTEVQGLSWGLVRAPPAEPPALPPFAWTSPGPPSPSGPGPQHPVTSGPSLPHQPVLPVAPAVGAVASLCFPGRGGAARESARPGLGALSGFPGTLVSGWAEI